MPYRNRIKFLEEAHRVLDKQIASLEKENRDTSDLKKKKLSYKDEISRLTRLQHEESQRIEWDDDR